jgi:putative phosphoribosyl transferase
MISAARARQLPDIALQFGPADFAVLSIPDASVGTVVVLAPSGRSPAHIDEMASLLNDQQLGTINLSLPLDISRSSAAEPITAAAGRVGALLAWMGDRPELSSTPIGCFGVGCAAAVVLRAAEAEPRQVDAVVTVAGWTDLVDAQIPLVEAPTLLIEGAADQAGVDRAWRTLSSLGGDAEVETVAGARDPMATTAGRRQVAELAGHWFRRAFAGAANSAVWRLAHERRPAGDPASSLFT